MKLKKRWLLILIIPFLLALWSWHLWIMRHNQLVFEQKFSAEFERELLNNQVGPSQSISNSPQLIRILAIDGGGVRGIIPAHVLAYLEQKTHQPTAKLFDLIVPVSTGAILATGVATPNAQGQPKYSAKETITLYHEKASYIFYNTWYHRLLTLNGLIGPLYYESRLTDVYNEIYQDTRFDHLLTKEIVPVLLFDRRKLLLLNNWQGNAQHFKVKDIVTAATAAPGYFPLVLIKNPDTGHTLLVGDGSTYSNNPTLIAFNTGLALYPHARYLIVSLGTGDIMTPLDAQNAANWGLLEWGWKIWFVITNTQTHQLEQRIADLSTLPALSKRINYQRYNIPISFQHENFGDASQENLAYLDQKGEELVTTNKAALDRLADLLVQNSNSTKATKPA